MMTGPSRSLGFRHGWQLDRRPFSCSLHRTLNRFASHNSLSIPLRTSTTMADSDFVVLESNDGYTFVVARKVALASGTLRAMLDEDGELREDLNVRVSL